MLRFLLLVGAAAAWCTCPPEAGRAVWPTALGAQVYYWIPGLNPWNFETSDISVNYSRVDDLVQALLPDTVYIYNLSSIFAYCRLEYHESYLQGGLVVFETGLERYIELPFYAECLKRGPPSLLFGDPNFNNIFSLDPFQPVLLAGHRLVT